MNKKVVTQLLPAEAPKPESPEALLAKLVQEKVAEALAEKEDLVLRPFFDTHNVAAELRRLQKMPARRKWTLYFSRHGCLVCGTKKSHHNSCGMCVNCYLRTSSRLRAIVGEQCPSKWPRQIDGAALARKCLQASPRLTTKRLPRLNP